MSQTPRFEDEFLESIAVAFRKRRKSLSHRTDRAECSKVFEQLSSEREERLEIDLVQRDRSSLRLWAWPERHIWLDARRSTKVGWAWEWTHEGRLLGEKTAREVIVAVEETHAMLYNMNAGRVQALFGPWTQLLARGPKLVS